MSLNQELIQKRCEEIEDSIKRLEKIKKSTKDEFLKNRRKNAVEEPGKAKMELLRCWPT